MHCVRNRFSRLGIAKNMDELEEEVQEKKHMACLKDIDPNDYRDKGMASILLDCVSLTVHKDITMKHATVDSNAISLHTAMLQVEKIIQREKDRVQSKKDWQTNGQISALQQDLSRIFTSGTTGPHAGTAAGDKEMNMMRRRSKRRVHGARH